MKITKDQHVAFDEFSRACDLVEEYFGDTIDDVALNSPVSRQQLVAVLARAQLSGRQLALEGLPEDGRVVYRSDQETLLWLDGGFWTDVRDTHNLEADEGRAAREVHRRILEAVDGDVGYTDRQRDPFVLIDRFGRYDGPSET
ncbi:hypothetical protein [Natrarchaeobius oligotrophus]|uniref:DUF8048 domain-containing protein n=1 Tax=Natrarchaeobius chitinivorans TaxID=1679083 RepID=A0A3N6PBQ2_NATCH|nr:hypothetical protein [Natrarchaeobius chitinivorans]RQG96759.1 hypothetical protein EA472_20115 [Natrarchaeobius chitinivorans]